MELVLAKETHQVQFSHDFHAQYTPLYKEWFYLEKKAHRYMICPIMYLV